MQRLFMIGHSDHPYEAFEALLRRHQVKLLLDVRTNARSRLWYFNGPALKTRLDGADISYRHVPDLGGKPPLPLASIQKVIDSMLPLEDDTCFMCSEGNYLECHRHYLLAPFFLKMGYNVVQILKTGELLTDSGPTDKLLVKMAKSLPGGIPESQTKMF